MNISWNAKEYKTDFRFVHQYGESLIELIDWKPGIKILDLGCGNGALTKKLYDMGAKAVGIDASDAMLEIARKDYPEIHFHKKDASNFTMEEKFDVVFSNAVFHWIDDQESLLQSIAGVLKPGGQLVCEFGGYGCCEKIHSALEKAFHKRGLKYKRSFYFPTIGEYTPIMERNGLRPNYAILFDRKTQLSGEDGMMDWINMFDKIPFETLDDETAKQIKEEAVMQLKENMCEDGVWFADYVRIRIRAVHI